MAEKKLSQLLLETLDNTATKEEVSSIATQLIDFVKQSKEKLEELADQKAAELDAKLSEIGDTVQQHETKVAERQDGDKSAMYSESRTLMRLIEQKAIELEAMMPESYDDTEIKNLIEETRKSIPIVPAEFDASSILSELTALIKRIDTIEKIIDDLRKRPAQVGGGVTNLRIQQAFKYLLKTEAPVGLINGSNTVYTVKEQIFAVFAFMLSGETIAQLPNYTISGRTITFSSALPAAYSGKDFEIKYI